MHDAIIIGGGHNGLVTAALLAQAGHNVLVLEQRDTLGGVAATEEIFPGFKIDTGLVDAGMFRPEVVEALALDQHGLEFIQSPVTAFAPQPDGTALTLWRDLEKSQAEIARFSEADAEKFPAFIQAVSAIIARLDGLMTRTPPNLNTDQLDQIIPWLAESFGLSQVSKTDFTDFLRPLTLSATEFLDEWFQSDALKGVLGSAGVMGTMQGPKAPYTAATMLYHYLGQASVGFRATKFVNGGVGQLAEALAAAARAHGAEIRRGASVAKILVDDDGRATGVELADGEQLFSWIVVSSADPRRTFFDLVGPPNFEVRFVRSVKNIRFRGSTAKLNLALSGLPEFVGQSDDTQLSGHIIINPNLDYLERAFDDAKYGRFSAQPYLDVVIPTLLDPSLAPAGQHVMSITMQYAPYHLRQSNWDEQREALGDRIIDTLTDYAPNLKELILHRQVITPLDFERDYGLTEGSLYHGQMELAQMLFMRPLAGFAQYRAPIADLYLCGAGAHPGGGLTGAPGYNAAREILKDLSQF